MALTFSIAAAANLASYAAVKYRTSKKPMLAEKAYLVAWKSYEKKIEKLTLFIQENQIFTERSLNAEGKGKGLEIIDAYYGLEEHIYLIDEKLLIFKLPTTIEEYYEQQVVPIKK